MYKIFVKGDRGVLDALPEGTAVPCEEDEQPDAVLVMPGRHEGPIPAADTVIAPAQCRCRAKQLITYGTGPRDTVTFSSVSGDYQVLSLQREIVTLQGMRLEQQELLLPPNSRPQRTLAASALMLAAGVPPSALALRLEYTV